MVQSWWIYNNKSSFFLSAERQAMTGHRMGFGMNTKNMTPLWLRFEIHRSIMQHYHEEEVSLLFQNSLCSKKKKTHAARVIKLQESIFKDKKNMESCNRCSSPTQSPHLSVMELDWDYMKSQETVAGSPGYWEQPSCQIPVLFKYVAWSQNTLDLLSFQDFLLN